MDLLFLLFLPCILWKVKFNRTGFCDAPLSVEKTGAVKGVLAVLIVLHHLSQRGESGVLRLLLSNLGVPCVCIFFFFSGYGLQKSYTEKPDYRAAILRRRVPSVLVRYLCLIPLYWGLGWIAGNPFTFGEVLRSLVNGYPVVSYSWYTICIVLFYVNYFMSTMLFGRRYRGILLSQLLFVVLWIAVCRALGYEEYWYNTAIAFPLGIFWAVYEEKLTPWLQKHYASALILSFLCFGFFFGAALAAMRVNVFVSLYWAASCAFVLFLLLILMKFTFQNPVLRFLGEISFEIYGLHGLFMILYRSRLCCIENPFLWGGAVLVSTITAAWVLHRFFRRLLCKIP